MTDTNTSAPRPLTSGKIAQGAGIGVETIRYYEREKLLPKPARHPIERLPALSPIDNRPAAVYCPRQTTRIHP
ncbi:MAG: MerR family DNA-binding transcriptional regulator [Nannocystaceae bacterium]